MNSKYFFISKIKLFFRLYFEYQIFINIIAFYIKSFSIENVLNHFMHCGIGLYLYDNLYQ
jgi:hypothetical protein